jgi:glycosyltransferase involved in cell wall biosynthesis
MILYYAARHLLNEQLGIKKPMVSKRELTVCLVIHNEEKLISRCLQSLSKVSNNIFVIHDGKCSDRSLTICREYGCKVIVRNYTGEAEPHRAWQYKHVTTKWVLQLDADEYLSDEFIANIEKLIKKNANGYTCIWPFWNGKRYTTSTWPRKLVLFQLNKAKFIAAPHEAAQIEQPVINTPYILEHKPSYDNLSYISFKTKWMRWAKVHANYYKDTSVCDTFGYKKNEKSKIHYFSFMQHPLLSCIPLFVYHSLTCMISGGFSQGWVGIKSSLMMGAYYFIVSLYVFINKNQQNH